MRASRLIVFALVSAVVATGTIATAGAQSGFFRVGSTAPVANNPAEKYAARVIEAPRGYSQEVPSRCLKAKRSGVDRFAAWLKRNAKRGRSGSRYRCENLGAAGYSFHSEARALDFSLNRSNSADAREARRLLRLLLARDSAGEPAALARRMGVMEIIWDCGYWSQNREDFIPYFLCEGRVSKTLAHRDHIHFSFTRAGAAARTSFWKKVSQVPRRPPPEPEPAPEPEPVPEPEPLPEPTPEPSGESVPFEPGSPPAR